MALKNKHFLKNINKLYKPLVRFSKNNNENKHNLNKGMIDIKRKANRY